jgi:hypothetical protein
MSTNSCIIIQRFCYGKWAEKVFMNGEKARRELCKKGLHNMYTSLNIVRLIKSRIRDWWSM